MGVEGIDDCFFRILFARDRFKDDPDGCPAVNLKTGMMEERSANPFSDPSTAEGYEAWYSTTGRRADRLEKALLGWLLRKLPQGSTILEVGCGTGHFTRWFKTFGLKSVGLDLSPAMLGEAVLHGDLTWVRGDAHHLPFVSRSYDYVALITTLEFLRDPVRALREARRVACRALVLGVINRKGWIGRQYRRQGGSPWEYAQFFTLVELARMVQQLNGVDSKVLWRTTLWRFLPCALPLPWGGFIGMAFRMDDHPGEHDPMTA